MREILFRAKRTDNGEWVEGYFVKGKWYLDEKEKYAILPIDLCFYPHCEINEWIEIDPETVRQYTGLTDKNGEKVFVGDIIRCTKGRPHEVIWLKEYAGTYLGGMPAVYLTGLREGYAWTGKEEKIGNVFDNPELLKENEDAYSRHDI